MIFKNYTATNPTSILDIETFGIETGSPIREIAYTTAPDKIKFQFVKPQALIPGKRGLTTGPILGAAEASPFVTETVQQAIESSVSTAFQRGEFEATPMGRIAQGLFQKTGNIQDIKKLGVPVYFDVMKKIGVSQHRAVTETLRSFKGKDVWVQNLPFELRQFGSQLDPSEVSPLAQELRLQGSYPKQQNLYATSPLIHRQQTEALRIQTSPLSLTQKLQAWEDVYTKGILPELKKGTAELLKEGAGARPTRLFDIQTLTKSVFAMAQLRGYMPKTGDVMTGTGMNVFSKLTLGKEELHTAVQDVALERTALETYMDMAHTMSSGEALSQSHSKLLGNIGEIVNRNLRSENRTRTLVDNWLEIQKNQYLGPEHGKPYISYTYGTKEKSIYKMVDDGGKLAYQKTDDALHVRIPRETARFHNLDDIADHLDNMDRLKFEKNLVNHKRIKDYIEDSLITKVNQRVEREFGIKDLGQITPDKYEDYIKIAGEEAESFKLSLSKQTTKAYQSLAEPSLMREFRGLATKHKGKLPYAIGGGIALGLLGKAIFGGSGIEEMDEDVGGGAVSPYSPVALGWQLARASSVGKTPEKIAEQMMGVKGDFNDIQRTSMETGTALHALIQKKLQSAGLTEDIEKFVYDPKFDVTGHIDVVYKSGEVSDVKTLSYNRFREVVAQGKPFQPHLEQVNFYAITTGAPRGMIEYTRATDPRIHKTYSFKPSYELYMHSMAKVERARDIARGGLPNIKFPLIDRMEDVWQKFYDFTLRSTKSLHNEYAEKRAEYQRVRSKKTSQQNNLQKSHYLANSQMRVMMDRENCMGHTSYRSKQAR